MEMSNAMQIVNALIALVGVIAWPAVVFTFLLWNKDQIRLLIPKLRKVGREGVEFTSAQSQQAEAEHEFDPLKIADLMNQPPSPTREALEESIRVDLVRREINIRPQEGADLLIRHLAVAQLNTHFLWIHYHIFGSQIRLLRRLNPLAPGGMSKEMFESWFAEQNALVANLALTGMEPDQYLAFLRSQGLISGPESPVISLTEKGRDYLAWITWAAIDENKAL